MAAASREWPDNTIDIAEKRASKRHGVALGISVVNAKIFKLDIGPYRRAFRAVSATFARARTYARTCVPRRDSARTDFILDLRRSDRREICFYYRSGALARTGFTGAI